MDTLGFSVRISQESVLKLTQFLVYEGIPFSLQPTAIPSLDQHSNLPPAPMKKIVQEEIIVSNYRSEEVVGPPLTKPNDLQLCKELMQKYLNGDFSQPIPTEVQIAKKYGISVMKLKLLFKRVYGKTLYQMYMDKRMAQASLLLKSGYKAVEVTRLVGYSANSSIKFNKMFQKYFGMTPKKYQITFRESANLSSHLRS